MRPTVPLHDLVVVFFKPFREFVLGAFCCIHIGLWYGLQQFTVWAADLRVRRDVALIFRGVLVRNDACDCRSVQESGLEPVFTSDMDVRIVGLETIDFLGTADLRERVEVLLGFDDLRGHSQCHTCRQ